MHKDNPNKQGATPFPRRLSVSLNYAELEPELNAFIHATLVRSPELNEQKQTDPARIAQTLRRVLEKLPPLNTRQDDEARAFLSAQIQKLEGAGNDD